MARNNRVIASLDIGSSKIACFIAELDDDNKIHVLGHGQHISTGMRRGMIVDMDKTESAIRHAVEKAEDMAGLEISGVVVGVGGVHLRSHTTDGLVVLNNQEITGQDLDKVIQTARARQIDGEREILHAIPTRYLLDNQTDIRDPRGMTGTRLEADVHIITAAASAVKNIRKCVDKCQLDVHAMVAQPYATAKSVLTGDEKDLGTVMVDMGGGTCDIAIYSEGALVYTAVIPLGGNHMTQDIARGISVPLGVAERIKALHGVAMVSAVQTEEPIELPPLDDSDDEPLHVQKSALAGIIQPRAEEILEMIRDKIEQSGFAQTIGRRVVLTGGSSQLMGLKHLAEVVLEKSVRVAKPEGVMGLTDLSGGASFSTSCGLLLYGQEQLLQRKSSRVNLNIFGGLSKTFGRLLGN